MRKVWVLFLVLMAGLSWGQEVYEVEIQVEGFEGKKVRFLVDDEINIGKYFVRDSRSSPGWGTMYGNLAEDILFSFSWGDVVFKKGSRMSFNEELSLLFTGVIKNELKLIHYSVPADSRINVGNYNPDFFTIHRNYVFNGTIFPPGSQFQIGGYGIIRVWLPLDKPIIQYKGIDFLANKYVKEGLYFYEKTGQPQNGVLAKDTTINNLVFAMKSEIFLHENGAVDRGVVKYSFTNKGMTFKPGRYSFFTNGALESGTMTKPIQYKQFYFSTLPVYLRSFSFSSYGGYIKFGMLTDKFREAKNIYLYPNGNVSCGRLNKDIFFPLKNGSLYLLKDDLVSLYPQGSILYCTISIDQKYNNLAIFKEDMIEFYESGMIKQIRQKKSRKINGFNLQEHTPVIFYESGQMFSAFGDGAQEWNGLYLNGLPSGTSMSFYGLSRDKVITPLRFHPGGGLSESTLGEDTVIQGFPLKKGTKVQFYPNGKLRLGTVSVNHVHTFPNGRTVLVYPTEQIRLDEKGYLIWLYKRYKSPAINWDQIYIKGQSIEFYPQGIFKGTLLARAMYYSVNGKNVMWDEWYFSLYEDGKIRGGTLNQDVLLNGISLSKSDKVAFYPDGRFKSLTLVKDVVIDMIKYQGSGRDPSEGVHAIDESLTVEFHPGGKVYKGVIAEPFTFRWKGKEILVNKGSTVFLDPQGALFRVEKYLEIKGEWGEYTNVYSNLFPSNISPEIYTTLVDRNDDKMRPYSNYFESQQYTFWVKYSDFEKRIISEIMTHDGSEVIYRDQTYQTKPWQWLKVKN